jgi:hypothetical protein
MALVINDTTYAGEVASTFISAAVSGADTIEKGCIFVQDGIKKKKTIPKIDVSNFMQRRAATPVSGGTVTVDGADLEPQDAMLYYEFNPRDFEQHWSAAELKPKLLDTDLPVTVENFMIMQTMKRLNSFWDNSIWRGRKQYDTEGDNVDPTTKGAAAGDAAYFYHDGLIKKALDNANTLAVATPVALTDANILAKMALAIAKIPDALLYKYGKGGVKWLMSNKDKQKYDNALIALTNKSIDPSNSGPKFYQGYDIETIAGMPENTFFVCVAKPDIDSNLWVGMNSVDDNELKLAPLANNSELYFVKGLFKVDTQIGFADQLVIYSTLTA